MASPRPFPPELLQAPTDDRITWFRDNVIVKHRNSEDAFKDLEIAISDPPDGAIVMLFGPAGSGKSTILHRLERAIIKAALSNLNPGCIPFLMMEAPGPDNGMYDWMDHYTRGLLALNEVLIKYKVSFNEDTKQIKRINLNGMKRRELRRVYEDALIHRQVRYVGMDEGHNLATIAKGRRLFDQTECLKSLGSLGKALHILAGSYRLLDLRSLSGQVSRRSVNIHLAGYSADDDKDITEFKRVVLTFQRYLPLPEEPELEGHWEYLYTYSCGCVGVLKDWLTKAYRLSLKSSRHRLTLRCLEKTALSLKDLDRLSSEIQDGKRRLLSEENEGTLKVIKKRLGLNIDKTSNSAQLADSPPIPTPPGRTRVGEPAPQRFPVGV